MAETNEDRPETAGATPLQGDGLRDHDQDLATKKQVKSKRWRRLALAIAAGLLLFFGLLPELLDRQLNRVIRRQPPKLSAPARVLHQRLFVADLHADTLLWARDPLERHDFGQVDIPRLIEGGVALQAFTIVTKTPLSIGFKDQPVPPDVTIRALAFAQRWPLRSLTSLLERARYQCERLDDVARRGGARFRVIHSQAELDAYLASRAESPKQTAGFLGVEGLHCLEGRIENLDELFRAGVRMAAPTHFFDTALGGSAHGTSNGGLTDFGRRCIARMEELGILVDLAHASTALIDDVLAIAKKPVVFSHTGVRGAYDSQRNIATRQLDDIKRNGGLVGIAFFRAAVGRADVDAIVESIAFVAKRIGANHVALGSDFDGSVKVPFDCSGVPIITEKLLAAGFSAEDIAKIMGGNIARVLRASLPKE